MGNLFSRRTVNTPNNICRTGEFQENNNLANLQSEEKNVKTDLPNKRKNKLVDLVNLKMPHNITKLDLSKFNIENSEILYDVLNRIDKPLDVKILKLSGQDGVKEVPWIVGRFANLDELDLSDNYIEEIPWAIVYLKKLKVLDLSHNMLTQIPKTIGYLSQLHTLNVKGNHITHLPSQLQNLDKLKELNLSLNKRMISPPLEICEKGVDAIFQHMQKRSNRRDEWEFTTPWIGGKSRICETSVKSLHEICVYSVMSHKVDYIAAMFVPPRIKAHLTEEAEAFYNAIHLAKCNVCGGFFSCKATFDSHDCAKNMVSDNS